jgi:hypothetical protein
MAGTYNNTVKTTRMTAVKDAIDAGAGAGKLKIYSAGYAALLATFTCSDPCGSVAGDPAALTLSGMPKSTTGAADGTAAIARLTDSADTMVREGMTVGTSGTDIIIDNTSITTGQTVNWTSGVITHG